MRRIPLLGALAVGLLAVAASGALERWMVPGAAVELVPAGRDARSTRVSVAYAYPGAVLTERIWGEEALAALRAEGTGFAARR